MPGRIGNFAVNLPVIGSAEWAGDNSAALQDLADAINAGCSADGLDIQDDIDLRGYALVNASELKLTTLGDDDGTAGKLFFNSDGELCTRDLLGRLIQITSGGFINISGTGGIGGDYAGSNPNGATYSAATQTFTFTSSPGVPAKIECGDIVQGQGSDANRVTLRCPTSLAGDYSLTWPAALPAALRLTTIDATGSIHHTDRPTVTDLTGSQLRVAGSASLAGPVLQPNVQSQCLSGSYAFIGRQRPVDVSSGIPGNASTTLAYTAANNGWFGQGLVDFPVPLDVGDRLTAVVVGMSSVSPNFIRIGLYFRDSSAAATKLAQRHVTASIYDTFSLNAASITSGTMPQRVSTSGTYHIQVEVPFVNNATVRQVWVNYDRPKE